MSYVGGILGGHVEKHWHSYKSSPETSRPIRTLSVTMASGRGGRGKGGREGGRGKGREERGKGRGERGKGKNHIALT